MSSDDSGDSGFDKEAEREKLREKYEQDQQDRENTRRMSELLLQGATMTGKHCGECGDPIFRYDGQEFCPTCQREVEGGDGQQASQRRASGESDAQAPDQSGDRSVEQPAEQPSEQHSADGSAAEEPDSDEARETTESDEEPADGEPRVEINDVRVADRHADRSNLRQPPSKQDERADRGRESSSRTHEGGRVRRHDHDHSHGSATTGGRSASADDLATARESLVRKLTDLARRAEETDDVARSRDLLAATREAAEALAALDRANR